MWRIRRDHILLLVAVGLLMIPRAVSAQDSSRRVLVPGIRVGTPEQVAVGGGLLWIQSSGIDHFTAIGLFAEGGVAGARMGVGFANVSPGPAGFQLRTSIMRTWGEPWSVGPNQTFVGAEVRLTILVTLSAGYFLRLNGASPGDARHFSFGIGIGL